MLKILITSPSLDTKKNVSGIASVVKNIILIKDIKFVHFKLGRADLENRNINWFFKQLFLPIYFLFSLVFKNISIIHLNVPLNKSGVTRDFIFLLLAKMLKKKIIVHLHGGIFLMNYPKSIIFRQIIKYILNNGHKILVLSQIEKDSIKNLYNLKIDIEILPNAIDTNFYRRENESPTYTKLPLNFLFLGRLHESKGIFEIIEAFSKLKDLSNYNLFFCGDGPLKDEVCSSLENVLKNRFKYFGVVDGKDKVNILNESHVFLLPSRYGEGMPIALLEAMSMGLLPIITNDASLNTMIEHKVDGVIIAKKDSNGLAEALKLIIEFPSFINTASKINRKKIVEKFSLDEFHKKLSSIYSLLT